MPRLRPPCDETCVANIVTRGPELVTVSPSELESADPRVNRQAEAPDEALS